MLGTCADRRTSHILPGPTSGTNTHVALIATQTLGGRGAVRKEDGPLGSVGWLGVRYDGASRENGYTMDFEPHLSPSVLGGQTIGAGSSGRVVGVR